MWLNRRLFLSSSLFPSVPCSQVQPSRAQRPDPYLSLGSGVLSVLRSEESLELEPSEATLGHLEHSLEVEADCSWVVTGT